ncbi:MAG: hypothetical protein K6G56_05055 [Clostridiales bacterium]|nr:hypothetical protein [Clostridiales bacterium]
MEDQRICKGCGAMLASDDANCPYCGTLYTEPEEAEPAAETAEVVESSLEGAEPDHYDPSLESKPRDEEPVDENVGLGIIGAILFGLIGAALYFGLYQLGVLAGICGLVMFALASFGYGLFSGAKKHISLARAITAVIVAVALIFAAEYFCIAFEIFKAFKDEGITLLDAIHAVPLFLQEKEIAGAVIKDLAISYLLSAFAAVPTIIATFKKRKQS